MCIFDQLVCFYNRPICASLFFGLTLTCFNAFFFFFVKQKTASELRISDWISDVCSSDLSASEFGELVHHQGEEFIYVLEGRIEVHSEFYDPVTLDVGEGIYIDSSMGHAYVVADGFEEALVLGVCSSADDGL